MATQIQSRRDTATNWATNNPVLAEGQIAIELDTLKLKVGDGMTNWNSLSYLSSGGGGGATDLEYVASSTEGVITSSTGTNATIPIADSTNAGLFTPTEKTKLNNIESNAEVNTIDSDPAGIAGANQVTNVVSLTQSEYDAIATKDVSTLYIIIN